MEAVDKLLLKPIVELNVSKEFGRMAEANNFKNLQSILDSPFYKLPELPQSGYRIVRELINFLNAHGMGHLIKD
jgi:hypothetical protein